MQLKMLRLTKNAIKFVFTITLCICLVGRGQSVTVRRFDLDKEIQRAQRSTGIEPSELKNNVNERIADLEEEKKQCEDGQYWSFVVNECKSCGRDCPNGTNINHCGNECKNYFKIKKYKLCLKKLELKKDSRCYTMFGNEIKIGQQ